MSDEPVEEYGQLMSGGGVHVWNLRPELLEIYSLERRIEQGRRFGGRVMRRRVIVLDEWVEVGEDTWHSEGD
jgi:hypothetical protein